MFVVLVPFFPKIRVDFVELPFGHRVVPKIHFISSLGDEFFLFLIQKILKFLVKFIFNGAHMLVDGLYFLILDQALELPNKVFHGHRMIVQHGDSVPFFVFGILGILGVGFIDFIQVIVGLFLFGAFIVAILCGNRFGFGFIGTFGFGYCILGYFWFGLSGLFQWCLCLFCRFLFATFSLLKFTILVLH